MAGVKMKHYKDKNDNVYAYEPDGSQDHLIPKDFIAITDEEAKTLTTIVPTYDKKRASEYPSIIDFIEAYTEKEILSNSTKWDVYVTKYKKVRSDNPKV